MAVPLGSGMGAFPAGEGPCGHDPEDDASEVVVQERVGALYFDPYDRVYLQNADRSMVAGTGPMQRAAHLLLPVGSLPATANSGLDVRSIKRALPAQRQRVIENELRIAWRTLIEAGQIRIGKVTLDPSIPWSGKFYVEVTDLTTNRTAVLNGGA